MNTEFHAAIAAMAVALRELGRHRTWRPRGILHATVGFPARGNYGRPQELWHDRRDLESRSRSNTETRASSSWLGPPHDVPLAI